MNQLHFIYIILRHSAKKNGLKKKKKWHRKRSSEIKYDVYVRVVKPHKETGRVE